jgi:23S rRNA (adenine-N6)-dimethyltransferase
VAAPRQWGWHRLHPRWAAHLVADANVPAGATVIDVGAGTGALTRPLVAAGARVIAVEWHPGRADGLRRQFAHDNHNVVVVQCDAHDLRLPRRPYHVIASPPFHVTAALLRRLLQPGSRLVTAHLVLQEQAARRWASSTAPGYGRWGSAFEVSLGVRVPRRAFQPRPRVDARVLVIRRARTPGLTRRPVVGHAPG